MILQWVLIWMSLWSGAALRADEAEVRPVFGAHPGYLFNVDEERHKRDIEMVMLDPPKPPPKPKSPQLLDEKLSKEFQDQYRYRFGQTYAEWEINNPARDDAYTYYNTQSVTVQAYAQYQQQFAQYMGRRLVEYDFDRFAKEEPILKPAYQAKDRFSNLDVKVKDGWKVKWKYNLSGPSMEVTTENPYHVENRVQMMMSGLISKPVDVITTIGYPITPTIKSQVVYKEAEQLIQLIVTKKLTRHISVSATTSSGQLPGDPTTHEDLYLLGFSWTE